MQVCLLMHDMCHFTVNLLQVKLADMTSVKSRSLSRSLSTVYNSTIIVQGFQWFIRNVTRKWSSDCICLLINFGGSFKCNDYCPLYFWEGKRERKRVGPNWEARARWWFETETLDRKQVMHGWGRRWHCHRPRFMKLSTFRCQRLIDTIIYFVNDLARKKTHPLRNTLGLSDEEWRRDGAKRPRPRSFSASIRVDGADLQSE